MELASTIRRILLGALAIIGALAILSLMVHIVGDVLLRSVANAPVPATYEIVTNYYMVGLAFIPLAWVEFNGGMVQVEVLDDLLSAGLRRKSDVIVALLSALIYSALAWFTTKTITDGTAALPK